MNAPIDYLRTMLEALTSAYTRQDVRNARRGLPIETNIGKLFASLAWGLQLVNAQAGKILEWDNIENAQGSVLDRYGANFGVARNGASDSFYRLLIKVKMLALLSGGDVNTVQNAAASLFDVPLNEIDLQEVFPAKISIHVDEALLSNEIIEQALAIMQMLKRIVAAGIWIDVSLNSFREFKRETFFMSAGFIDSEIKARPVDQSREYATPLYIGVALSQYNEITAYPVK